MNPILFSSSRVEYAPKAFAITFPWKVGRDAREHIKKRDESPSLVSVLVLKRYRDIPHFLYWTFRIRRQLAKESGSVGYSLKAELLRKRFWTLSAWESSKDMNRFVHSGAHRAMLADMKGRMADTKFADWMALEREVPLSWTDAIPKLNVTA